MLRLALLTTDNREDRRDYSSLTPEFGTAPAALLQGFSQCSDQIEVHVISCARVRLPTGMHLAPNIIFHSVYVPSWAWLRMGYAGCILGVRRCLKTIRPDLVHGQGTERDCSMSAVFSGYPNLITIHGNMRVHAKRPGHRLFHKLAGHLEAFCLPRTGGVIAISHYTADLIKDLAPRSWLLPNAVGQRFFAIEPTPPACPRILFVGSVDERKNPLGLIRACESMLRDGECTLAIAGQLSRDHPYARQVLGLADKLPSIEILGLLGRDELDGQLRRSSLLVLPSFEDNCPMVVLEAMAAGVPVAASRIGGIPDLIRDGDTGCLFDPGNPDSILSAVRAILSDPVGTRQRALHARDQMLRNHHPRIVACKHLEIYREELGRHSVQ